MKIKKSISKRFAVINRVIQSIRALDRLGG